MTDPEPPGGSVGGPGDGPPALLLSPSAARRRFAAELQTLREEAGQTLVQAGAAIERSAATISRFESAKYVPRAFEVDVLLNHYRLRAPHSVTDDVRQRVLLLAAQSRKKQWFDPFKDVTTGDMTSEHITTLMEYEADASRIRSYESDLVPGLLQTEDYARAVVQRYFPGRSAKEHDRWTQFRIARQNVLRARANPVHLSIVVNEVALRRDVGDAETVRAQLAYLLDIVRGNLNQSWVTLRIVPLSIALPAALGGPFLLFAFPEDSQDNDLVYVETRTGGNYLYTMEDVERFISYFESLVEVALDEDTAASLIESILEEYDGRDDAGSAG